MPAFPLDPETLAREIGIPLSAWDGNCHGVAEAVLRKTPVRGMRLVRGHYHGYVHKESSYSRGVCQHSWLELEDGRVLDPTRWAMEDPQRPAVYLGLSDEYDEAGLQISARVPPLFPGTRCGYETTLAKAGTEKLAALATTMGISAPTDLDPEGREIAQFSDRLRYAVKEHPDHLENAAAFYRALADCGLKALIKIDVWDRVMEPEKWSVPHGVNLTYDVPAAPALREIEKLHAIFCRFISVEERELQLESELEEIGYRIEDLWDALNTGEKWIRFMPEAEIEDLPNIDGWIDTLAVIVGDILGRGFGEDLRVEAYARSMGLPPKDLDAALIRFGKRAGYDLRWL